MDAKTVMSRYGKYAEMLEKLGKIALWINPTIEQMGLTRQEIQVIYRDLKKEEDIGIVEFLCRISTDFLIWNARSEDAVEVADFILQNSAKYETDTLNLLRLMLKDPYYFLKDLSGDHKQAIIKLFEVWFEYHRACRGKSKS